MLVWILTDGMHHTREKESKEKYISTLEGGGPTTTHTIRHMFGNLIASPGNVFQIRLIINVWACINCI